MTLFMGGGGVGCEKKLISKSAFLCLCFSRFLSEFKVGTFT